MLLSIADGKKVWITKKDWTSQLHAKHCSHAALKECKCYTGSHEASVIQSWLNKKQKSPCIYSSSRITAFAEIQDIKHSRESIQNEFSKQSCKLQKIVYQGLFWWNNWVIRQSGLDLVSTTNSPAIPRPIYKDVQ